MATEPSAPTTQTMYDQSGQAVEVPLSQVAEAYKSGQLGFAEGQQVFVQRGRDVISLDGKAAGELFDSPLGKLVKPTSEEAYAKQEEEKEYSGTLRGLEAAAYGGARGLTLGGSDWLAANLGGEDTAAHLRKLEEHRPVASLVGEGVGIGLPLLFTGGASGAGLAARGAVGAAEAAEGVGLAGRVGGLLSRGGEIATALPRGIGALGRGAEALAGRGLAEVGLAETGLTSRALRAATGAAVEGSFYGVGQAVSDASLRNEELTAEKLLAAAGHGALLGGVLGGSVTVAGAAIKGAVSKTTDAAEGLLGRLRSGEGQAAKATEAAEGALVKAGEGEAQKGLLAKVEKRQDLLAKELADAAPKEASTIQILAKKAETEYTIKALGATPDQVGRLKQMGDDITARVVRLANEDSAKILGKSDLAFLSKEARAEASSALREQAGTKVGDLIDEIGSSSIKPDIKAVTADLFRSKINPLAEQVGTDVPKTIKKGKELLDQLDAKLEGKGIKELWDAKKSLGDEVKWKKLGKDEGSRLDKLKADIYRALDAEIARVGEAASHELGEGVAARWANANREYRAATWLDEVAVRGGNKAKAAEGPLSTISGTLETMGSIGLAALSGGAWAIPTLAGSKLVSYLARTYGSDLAAKIAGAASRGEMVKGMEGALDRQLGQKVAGLFGRTADGVRKTPLLIPAATALDHETGKREPKGRLEVRYQAKREQVAKFLASPEAHVEAATRGLEDVKPGVREALAKKATQGAQFLQAKAPVRAPDPLQPHLRIPSPSTQEMDKYLRYAKALDDPLSVLDDAKAGKVSREAVEALKAIYPNVYEELRARVTEQLVAIEKPLPYSQRLQLHILLDVPTDRTLEPQFVQTMQAAYAQAGGAPGQGPGPQPGPGPQSMPSRPIQIAKAYQTKASGLEEGV